MIAVPLALRVQRHQQQVRPRQIRQGRGRPGLVEHRLAQRAAHPLQHRGPGQEHPLPRGEPRQELRLHVPADQLVLAGKGDHRVPDRTPFPQRQRRQVQPCWPSLGPPVQLSHVILAERDPRLAQQRRRLGKSQRQVAGADLHDPALGAQPRNRQRRRVPSGQHQLRAVRHMAGQHRHRGPAFGVVQHVHVVKDQRHRQGHRRQRRSQPRHHRAGHRAARGGQRVEYPLVDRLDRIERFGDVGEQDLRVVVPFVQRHPGEGLAVALGPLRQQRRLPVPGRRHHRHDRKRRALPQPVNKGQPAHAARPYHRTAQLRRNEFDC